MLRFPLIFTICVTILSYVVQASTGENGEETLRVGAFNIQIFGQSKSKKPEVMEVLVKIIRRYDILLIQEIRDSKQTAIVKLLEQVNDGQPAEELFTMSISSRLGRTHSKEQYAYFYRPAKGLTITEALEFDDGNEALNTADKYVDEFEREPYMIKVSSQKTVPNEFVIIGIHVAPDKAVEEIAELDDVFDYAIKHMHVKDVVVMGDLNADCSYVRSKEWTKIPIKDDPHYKWPLDELVDTTVRESTDCAYDSADILKVVRRKYTVGIVHDGMDNEYGVYGQILPRFRFIFTSSSWTTGIKPGSVVVYEYDKDPAIMQNMSPELAIQVSDHYPIEFELYVSPNTSPNIIPKISIKEVYVELAGTCISLVEDQIYTITVSTDGNGRKLDVVDENNNVVGNIRKTHQDDLIKALFSILDGNLNSKPIEVVRQKRKYICRQKTIISVSADVDNAEKVKLILKNSKVEYEKKRF